MSRVIAFGRVQGCCILSCRHLDDCRCEKAGPKERIADAGRAIDINELRGQVREREQGRARGSKKKFEWSVV